MSIKKFLQMKGAPIAKGPKVLPKELHPNFNGKVVEVDEVFRPKKDFPDNPVEAGGFKNCSIPFR